MTSTTASAQRPDAEPGVFSRERWRTRRRRSLPPTLEPPLRWVVLAGYGSAGVLCVLILTGWLGAEEVPYPGITVRSMVQLVTLVTVGLLAALLALAAARHRGWRRAGAAALTVLLAGFACGWLPHGGIRVALVVPLLLGAVAAALWPLSVQPIEWARIVLAALPGLLAAAWQPFLGVADRTLNGISTAGLVPQAAIGLSALAVYAAVSSLSEHRDRLARVLTGPTRLGRLVTMLVLKVLLLVALFAGLTGDLLGGRSSWGPGLSHPLSWLHAGVLAGVVALMAVSSVTRPLIDAGVQPRLAILGLILAIAQLGALAAILVVTLLSVFDLSGLPVLGFVNLLIDHSETVQWVAVAILGLGCVLSVPRRSSLSTGWWLGAVSVLWLVPPLLGIAFEPAVVFWATPARVDAALTIAVGVLLLVPGVRNDPARRRMLLALLVAPVLMHLENLLPDAWSNALLRVTFVLAALNVLFWAAPPVRSDPHVAGRQRCLAVAGQLGILVAAFFVLQSGDLSTGPGTSAQLAWLWFSVPFVALITVRQRSADSVTGG